MSLEMEVESLVNKVNHLEQVSVGQVSSAEAKVPEEVGGILADLKQKILENFDNIDAEEAAALLAQIEVVISAYAAGSWIQGTLALAKLLRMYRAAIKS